MEEMIYGQSEIYWRGRKLRNTLAKGGPPPESQLNVDFFQVNNNVRKKNAKTKYINTKVKSKNLLINVSYRRYKQKNVEKVNIALDVFSFLTQNLNPTGLDRKLETALERHLCAIHIFEIYLFKRKFCWPLSTAHNLSKSK